MASESWAAGALDRVNDLFSDKAVDRAWLKLVDEIGDYMLAMAHEQKPSKSRPRIAISMGVWGA